MILANNPLVQLTGSQRHLWNDFEDLFPTEVHLAAALGLTALDITSLTYSCEDNSATASLDFPMLDDNTILLGLDNMVYTFKRAGS